MYQPFPPISRALPRTGIVEIPLPLKGVNSLDSPFDLSLNYAYSLNNFTLYNDRLQIRGAVANWITTDFANNVKRLHLYAAVGGTQTLWATTDGGIYNVSTTGSAPASSVTLTNGLTQSAILSTGAANYLIIVNAADSMQSYDGTTWTATATVGGGTINTNTFSYVEVYRQRVYFIVKDTTRIVYLNSNSPTGGGTNFDTAAIFRRGGYLVALGTWTIDGGTGPDDHLCLATSEGEIAVFTGNDPASWSYKGTYYIAPPLGKNPFLKFGGDLLLLCKSGVYPLSRALLTATVDQKSAITNKIAPVFSSPLLDAASNNWQMTFWPDIPALVVNMSNGSQWLMNTTTGGWFSYSASAYTATCVAYFNKSVYFGNAKKVAYFTGAAGTDFTTTSYTCTFSTPYMKLGKTTARLTGIQPAMYTDSTISAPVELGSFEIARAPFPDGTGTILHPQSLMYGGAVPARVDELWHVVVDDFSPWKQVRMYWTNNNLPLKLYTMRLSYMEGNSLGAVGKVPITTL